MIFQYMTIPQLISFTDGHLDCFQIGAILKSMAMNFVVTYLLCIFLLGVDLKWTFWIMVDVAKQVSKVIPIYIPTHTTT